MCRLMCSAWYRAYKLGLVVRVAGHRAKRQIGFSISAATGRIHTATLDYEQSAVRRSSLVRDGGNAEYRISWGGVSRKERMRLKPLVFVVSLWPAAFVLLAALTHQLNVNPFNAIVRDTGFWSLRFLCLTLAITPFRWLTGWHSVVKLRRMMGLFSFFYGTLHLLAYVVFDVFAAVDAADRVRPMHMTTQVLWAIGVDVVRRPFFAIGAAAFVLMVPLAATSTVGMIRRLGGRRWQTVHRLVYAAAIASVVHTYWPLTVHAQRYEMILGVVLALRLGRGYARRPPRKPLATERAYAALASSSSRSTGR
jgi:methionine sulfoxide reductase heme-binding subunit